MYVGLISQEKAGARALIMTKHIYELEYEDSTRVLDFWAHRSSDLETLQSASGNYSAQLDLQERLREDRCAGQVFVYMTQLESSGETACTLQGIFSITDVEGPAWATAGQVVLGGIRKRADQAREPHASARSALAPSMTAEGRKEGLSKCQIIRQRC